jgi:hypothetical protein
MTAQSRDEWVAEGTALTSTIGSTRPASVIPVRLAACPKTAISAVAQGVYRRTSLIMNTRSAPLLPSICSE